MSLPTTEVVSEGPHIDVRTPTDAAGFMLDGQASAIDAVRVATRSISQASHRMAVAIGAGNSLHYAAAGSSGLMALADASELRGTFGIPSEQIHIHMAGGVPVDAHMPGDTEDDDKAVERICEKITAGDVVIVLTASGSTPFAIAVARAAQRKMAVVIGIANNPGTPLLQLADEPICIATPPEVIAGSTRLGAGTAQKAALNLMSTLMGIELGHVYRGEMVNVIADNAKLVRRATNIVSRIAGVSAEVAQDAITTANGQVKLAILVAAGCSLRDANTLLEQNKGQLTPCFLSLESNRTNSSN